MPRVIVRLEDVVTSTFLTPRSRMHVMPWQPDEDTCSDCGFTWSIEIRDAIRLVQSAPDRFSDLFAKGSGAEPDRPDAWTSTSYLWHVVDVLRLGTERLWTLSLDSGSGVPGWDQEALAEVRNYDKLSPKVGLRALEAATRDWTQAAWEAPPNAAVKHPAFGALTTADSIRRNAHEVSHHARDVQRLQIED